MESLGLNDTQTRQNTFRQGIVANLAYWSTWMQYNQTNFAALDREYPHIIRALLFALELKGETWANSHLLIAAISPYMERRGQWPVWLDVLRRAIVVAQQLSDTTLVLTLSISLARLLQWQARFTQAKQAYRRVIRLARQTDNDFQRARAYSNLGFLYTEQGYGWRAGILCRQALRIFEQLDNDHGRAHTENHLGILYTRQGCYELAQQHLESACALWQTMGDDHGLMRGYINLGMLAVDQQHSEAALIHLQKALDQTKLVGEETETGLIYLNIGIAYRHQGDLVQAEAYARQALAVFKRFSNLMGMAQALGNLGLACLNQRKWKETISSFQTSLEIWQSVGSKQGELRTTIYILAYEVEIGNWQQAANQLVEVERLMLEYGQDPQHPLWWELLDSCRRRLKEGLRNSENFGDPTD